MATLLAELLHDLGRRVGEICDELDRLKGLRLPPVEAYRQEMQSRAERAKQLTELILSDPDLNHPVLAVNYFRDFRDIARLVQALENLPLLVLRRFNAQDELLTQIVGHICKEVAYPYEAPICTSLSSQYYWTVAGMDLIFVPSLEPERILGLADIYHELGHIVLFREEKSVVLPGQRLVDQHFDSILQQGKQDNWAPESIREVERIQHRWRTAWLLEFGSDLIATYLCGPSFGWCNIRTSTNIGSELFESNESHPADDARATAIGLMLSRLGEHHAKNGISQRWNELVSLSGDSKPTRYELIYPPALLEQLCELIFTCCKQLGLIPWSVAQPLALGKVLDDAWTEFRLRPDTFTGYERTALEELRKRVAV